MSYIEIQWVAWSIFNHLYTLVGLQLNRLVTEKWVDGWDDPRLLTLAGLRRRGVSSTAIISFIRGIGITRRLLLHFFKSYLPTVFPKCNWHVNFYEDRWFFFFLNYSQILINVYGWIPISTLTVALLMIPQCLPV